MADVAWWSAEPAFDAKGALALAESSEAKALMEGPRAGPEQFEKSAKAYIAKAREIGVDPAYWAVKGRGGYHYHSRGGDLTGVLGQFLGRKNTGKVVALLTEAGASPWMESAQGSPGPGVATGVKEWVGSSRLASQLMGDYWSLAARKAGLKSALARVPVARVGDFLKELSKSYEAATERASKTSKGVLGRSDKQAKDCAAVIDHCKAELLGAAAAWSEAGAPGAQAARAAADGLIKAAGECLSAKADKASAAVNPEKVRKAATAEQRLRSGALNALCRNFAGDEQLIALAFENTPWLAQTPMLASVSLGRDGSLMAAALSGGSASALRALEKAGANIWLAAAQAGEGNACAWVANLFCRLAAPDYAAAARLLMIGSWLDGAQDPKARCLELAREAVDRVASPYFEQPKLAAQALAAEIERLTLSELIGEPALELAQEGGSEEGKERPARRRSAL